MYINGWMYFVTSLNLVLWQPSTATLAKTKADIAKKALIATCLVDEELQENAVKMQLDEKRMLH